VHYSVRHGSSGVNNLPKSFDTLDTSFMSFLPSALTSARALKLWVLKRRSNLALIVGIILLLILTTSWHLTLAPSIIAGEIEKIDTTSTLEGILRPSPLLGLGTGEIPIQVKAHAYVIGVKGDNIILRMEINMTRTDTGEMLSDFSGNSTYVFNKFSRENVWGAPEADKNRTGYSILYPMHLKTGEDIPNVWLDQLDANATLKFKEEVAEEGITLYKYYVNKTLTKRLWIEKIGERNCILTSTKTILIEPLSGVLAYTENETFSLVISGSEWGIPDIPLVYLTYKSTAEDKFKGITEAKNLYDGIQLLELYIPMIMGILIIILAICLAFNVLRIKIRKQLKRNLVPDASTSRFSTSLTFDSPFYSS